MKEGVWQTPRDCPTRVVSGRMEALLEQAMSNIAQYIDDPDEQSDLTPLDIALYDLRRLKALLAWRADALASEIPRVLQPHLDEWERVQQVLAKTPEGWSHTGPLRYEDQLISYWLTLSWHVSLPEGIMLTGKTALINSASEMAHLTIQLDSPWHGIETVGGPITSFIPAEVYVPRIVKGALED